jgi:hydrogenase/urease accessory protein HupE
MILWSPLIVPHARTGREPNARARALDGAAAPCIGTPIRGAAAHSGTAALSLTRSLSLAAALCLTVAFAPTPASAHPLAPALFELQEVAPGRTNALWRTSRLQPRGANLRPTLTPDCRALGAPEYSEVDRAVEVRWSLDCGAEGLVGRHVAVEGLDRAQIDALVRITLADGRTINRMLRARDPDLEIPERQTRAEVMRVYASLGIEHILTGFDHLFFVLGLLLLIAGTRRLVQTITAFTLGHSLTLTLAVLGVSNVPSGPVELLIAISVLILAVELANALEPGHPVGAIERRPWLMGVTFGLLHGMGFAGALREIGLPQEEIPMALFSFNLGIEIGQLMFVAAVLLVLYASRPLLARAPRWMTPLPAYALGAMAAYWCFERGAGLFGA